MLFSRTGGVTALKEKIGFRGLDRAMVVEEALIENVSSPLISYGRSALQNVSLKSSKLVNVNVMLLVHV